MLTRRSAQITMFMSEIEPGLLFTEKYILFFDMKRSRIVRFIKYLSTLVVIVFISILVPVSASKYKGYVNGTVLQFENAERYRIARMNLAEEINIYLNKLGSDFPVDTLINECLRRDKIDIAMTIAQGELESGMGTRGRALKTQSVWGVGAWDNADHSKSISYKNYSESLKAYINLIENRYMPADGTHVDLLNEFVDLNGGRYASDPNYEKKLINRYNYINLTTKIDSLQKECRKYKNHR